MRYSALCEQALDLACIAWMHVDRAVEPAGTSRGLLLEQVLTVGLQPPKLACAGLLEPLCGRLAGLHLWHTNIPCWVLGEDLMRCR